MRRSEPEELEVEEELERRAREMFAKVVRPQFGSTSSARLLICVVMLWRREAAFCWSACEPESCWLPLLEPLGERLLLLLLLTLVTLLLPVLVHELAGEVWRFGWVA